MLEVAYRYCNDYIFKQGFNWYVELKEYGQLFVNAPKKKKKTRKTKSSVTTVLQDIFSTGIPRLLVAFTHPF